MEEDFFCDGAGGDAAYCFACGGAAAAWEWGGTVFHLVGEIGVGWAKFLGYLRIVFWLGVEVGYEYADGGAESFALVKAAEDLEGIGF